LRGRTVNPRAFDRVRVAGVWDSGEDIFSDVRDGYWVGSGFFADHFDDTNGFDGWPARHCSCR
jgi:hypothetical protein